MPPPRTIAFPRRLSTLDVAAAALDAVPEPLCIVDADGVVRAVNRAWHGRHADGGDAAQVGQDFKPVSSRNLVRRDDVERALHRQALQHGLLARLGQFALENPPLADLAAQAAELMRKGLDAELCRVLEAGDDDLTLTQTAGFGWAARWTREPFFDAVAETEDRFVLGAREAIVIADYETEPRFVPSPIQRAHGVRSAVEALICGTGGSYGVLGAYSTEPNRFEPGCAHFIKSAANILAAAIQRRHADEQLAYMAQFDGLTGLPNRTMYLDRLGQSLLEAERDHRPVGVLFIDLDRFKAINDSLGHAAGDKVLAQTAARLQAALRPGDTVGRLGGDEFAVVLEHLARADDAAVVAQKIVAGLNEPFQLGDQEAYVSASVGISVYPDDGREPDVLVKNADIAMYRAKESGRNAYHFYLPQMNERALARLQVEAALRGALERREFVLHYQPKVNLADGSLSGMEVLLRWHRPQVGLVSPGEFVPILEETGLIVAVGEWVVATVCEQIAAWQRDGLNPPAVAINLSPRQFRQRDLDQSFERLIDAARVEPSLVEFELTESMLMADAEAAVAILQRMKKRGMCVSIDDFGTGYSSLAYLKRFPIDALKIDRAFISDITTDADVAAIARAIIGLAHSLSLQVIAEGVETAEQVAFLRAHGCDQAQGYFFARPMAAGAMEERLRGAGRFALG